MTSRAMGGHTVWSCEEGGLSVLTKGKPQGHATGPVEPLKWSSGHHIQSAFYLLVCTQRGTYPNTPPSPLTHPSPLYVLPLSLIMRRGWVLPLYNKNLPPLPNNHSRRGKRNRLKSIRRRPVDAILPPEREQSLTLTEWLSSFTHGSVHY